MYPELVYYWFIFFVIRALPRIILKKVNNSDTYFHLYLINFIKENGVGRMIEEKRFTRPYSLQYPWVVHWVLSFLPASFLGYVERFFNPFWDSVYIISFIVIGTYLSLPLDLLVIGGFLYLFTPLTFGNLGTGPRVITFTPRLIGEVIGGIVFILEYLYFYTGDVYFVLLAIVLASSLYMMSKFSVQALVFINVVLAIVLLRIEPILLVIISFLLCIAYTKGFYLKILRQHIGHLKGYLREVLAGRLLLSERNNLGVLWRELKNRSYKKVLTYLMVFNSYFILFYKSPLIPVALFFLFERGGEGLDGAFLISPLIVFLITSQKWFLFVGEAERYLNYVLFFPVIIILENYENALWLVYMMIAYGVLYLLVDFYLLYRKSGPDGGDKNDKFIEYLNSLPSPLRFATIPYHLGCWRIVYETKHDWWGPNVFPGNEEDDSRNQKYWLKNPYLDASKCQEFMSDYNLNCIFIDKERYEKDIGTLSLPKGISSKDIGNGLIMVSNASKI